jgi:hypothetical protein
MVLKGLKGLKKLKCKQDNRIDKNAHTYLISCTKILAMHIK